MADLKDVGVVVVGLGRAGKVRVRDLKAKTCRLALKGVVSRRPNDIEDVTQISYEEALDRADVNAVFICTEPAPHEEYIRRALEKGKHVLVEYPLARSAKAARELFQLAEDKGLVLYEENIALLLDSFLAVKEKASTVGLKQATYSLSGSYNGWLEDFEGSGLPFVSGVGGLQVVLSLFGDLVVKGGKMDRREDGYTAQASLETQMGKPITMTLARSSSKEVKRTKETIYEFEDGETLDCSKIAQQPSKPGLFMQDLEQFDEFVGKGKLPEEFKWLSLRSLELAEQIHSFF